MRILVTGATGFVASHLVPLLVSRGHELTLTAPDEGIGNSGPALSKIVPCDLTNAGSVSALLRKASPDGIVHLAAISNVPKAQSSRGLVSLVNVVATHHLAAAASELTKPISFLFTSTALVYGGDQKTLLCDEATPVQPQNVYGLTKLSAECVVRSFESEQFRGYIVRPFNHVGPGQSPDFVCTALAKRVFEAPEGSTISAGNLEAQRDFSDVRDIVLAYAMILEQNPEPRIFVLGSGKSIRIRAILDRFVELSQKSLEVTRDEKLLRPHDDGCNVANATLAQKVLGWRPVITFDRSLRDIYCSLQS